MADYKVTVGNVEMLALTDGQGDMQPLDVFADSSMEQWQSEYPELLDRDLIHPRFGTTAVRSSGKLIIVDTGLQAPNGTLMEDMHNRGIDAASVDLVVLTHLHPDHIGWNLTDGNPTFPNARYLATKSDWDYWTSPAVINDADHIKQQALPLRDLNLIDLIEGEYRITDELTTIDTPGHTPGHISIMGSSAGERGFMRLMESVVEPQGLVRVAMTRCRVVQIGGWKASSSRRVSSAGERGFILGDVAHSPAQAHYTDWSPVFDVDSDLSRRTRHAVLDRLENEGMLVSAGHFPGNGFGRFVRDGSRRIWQGI